MVWNLKIAKFRGAYHPWDWYIYLHEWFIFMVNVGKYTIHGSYGWVSLFKRGMYYNKGCDYLRFAKVVEKQNIYSHHGS